ncbi:1332_t:CDS:2 [Funneliformis geosporum]|uniref:15568_t:CDS:1 n=1 Tax=Funneliformis geosporum TaxID=1117311 RepID=A0A9W4WYW3_9GLOM|nr:1332_t:CDS:2 [Funneliformis geosporum]CAI2182590.1 15568_t:CDS:2 [Funneliformis geosporum]
MTTLPTLPPISTLSYNHTLPPIISSTGNSYHNNNIKGHSNVERSEQQPPPQTQPRYSSSSSLSMNIPQSTPTTPYSASSNSSFSSTSSFSYSPLPQQPPPTQPPAQLSQSQPSYYQRSPPASFYSQPTYSYSQYSQSHSPAQPSCRRSQQQIQHYPSSQQYNLQSPQHHPHSQISNSQQSPTPIRPFQRNHNSQNVISEPFVTVKPELNNRPPRRRRRPPFSYSSLIAQAILDSPDRRLTLREVYQWIMERYPQLYKADDTGWQNTIRHNLSLNKCFKKVPRSDTELGHSTSSSTASKGKGGYWTIDPEYMSSYHDGVFARGGVQKRRPGEVGLHQLGGSGLGDDDSGGSDTPSDNMAGRLVDIDDDVGNNGMPLTLTVPPPVVVSSSASLMTPPPTSNLLPNKSKFFTQKKTEQNLVHLVSPSSPSYSSVNASGSTSGSYDVFRLAELNDKPNAEGLLDGVNIPLSDRQYRVINRNLSPYPVVGSRGGPCSEWNMGEPSIKREIDDSRHSYYYGNHSRGVTDLQQFVGVGDSNSSLSSVAGTSSMKIRDLLN